MELISRQQAIDAVMECYDNDELFEVYEWKLNELPPIQPAEPKRIKGKWVGADAQCGIACSVCGVAVDDFCHSADYIDLDYKPNFCPNCGADMREVNNESN